MIEIDLTKECSQCGMKPDELDADAQPKIEVLEMNFGEPYLFGVTCQVCGRIAKGVGRDAAVQRWNDGAHDLNTDMEQ